MATLLDLKNKPKSRPVPTIPKDYTPHPTNTAWSRAAAQTLFELPFMDLVMRAQTVHRENFNANQIQMSQLLSIKTGGCAENCGYCNQSASFDTGLKASKLMDTEAVIASAQKAKSIGAHRFCMGAAWRAPKERDMADLCEMVSEVKSMGLETCMTLGMLEQSQAERLSEAGLDYYNHNIDTSPEDYGRVVSTRTFEDRLHTLNHVREAGMSVCCGGIVGMGEQVEDRVGLLMALANMDPAPESVPINSLVPVPGTPLGDSETVSGLDFVRLIAMARIMMPKSYVRLSAGRDEMSDETQALCFMAGANSVFIGETLLTTDNPNMDKDTVLFAKLGIKPENNQTA